MQAGSFHAITLDASGKLWSWGNNVSGQLTLPSPQHRSRPTRPHIPFGSVRAAAVGSDGNNAHYLLLHKDGTISSFGSNTHGQLGNNETTDYYTMTTNVARFSGVVKVAASRNASSYAITSAGNITSDGKLYAWGNNDHGQLGIGSTNESHSVQRVGSLTGVIAVAPGLYHTLALMGDGSVYAWGYNGYGQLGDGTTTNQYSPIQVPGLTKIVAIAAGDYFSLALKNDGTVLAWGDSYYSGSSPTLVSGLPSITAIAAGADHALALTSDGTGTVYSWGRNDEGELGIGTTNRVSVPQQVMTGAIAISAGSDNDGDGQSFAIKNDNSVWAWGNDRYGQLGDGVLTPSGADWNRTIAQPTPAKVDLPGVRSIVSCGGVTLALVKDVEPYLDTDDQPDMLCQNTLTKNQQAWYMNGTGLTAKADFGVPISDTWTLGGMGDLNGDGYTDLLWQKSANSPLNPGNVNAWLMNGTATPTYVNIYHTTPVGWNLVGVADTNNDGSPDMIWQAPPDANTGAQRVKSIHLRNGVLTGDGSLLVTLPAGWRVAGTADMDGDGWPDIIAQNTTTGAVRVWYIRNELWTGATDELAPGQSGWHLASIQDLDGDSNPDLIWQTNWGTSTGNVIWWQMDDIVGYTGTQYTISTWSAGESIARAH